MDSDFLIGPEREREIAQRLGAELARHREAAGMTQDEAAYRMGIGNQAVSRMERGAVLPSLKRVMEFAGLFGCRVDQLTLAASDREVDQEAALSQLLAGLCPSDRDDIVAIVRQLVALVGKRGPERRPG